MKSKYQKIGVLILVASVCSSCADAFAAAGYLLGIVLEWSLIISGVGFAIYLLILLIMWIISWFK